MGLFSVLVPLCLFIGVTSSACTDCNWNGRCTHNKCNCFQGYYGANCDGDCGCKGHGYCAKDYTCNCDVGWRWDPAQRTCVWDCHCQNGAGCIGPGECACTHTCKYGACRNGQCVCWEGYTGEDCSHYDPNIMMNKDVPVGMNVGGISYYSSEMKFVDIHKQSEEWITQRDGQHTWNTHEENSVQYRKDGYPASLQGGLKVLQLMERGFAQFEEQGNFTVLYDGDGVLEFGLTSEHIDYEGKGRIIVNMPKIGKGGFYLMIHKTNPQNPVRNIRVLIPGYENLHERFPFHPIFLENLKRYSELRFMDFLHTNGHTPEPTTWKDRCTPSHYTQAGDGGGAIEYMIQLANTLGTNAWFNMPHAATDDYVREFAQLVKNKLRPDLMILIGVLRTSWELMFPDPQLTSDPLICYLIRISIVTNGVLKVYIEYSNEVWNGRFRQAGYAKEQGMKQHLDPADYRAGFIFYGRRAAQVMDIWKRVYGADKDKLYPVFAWQTGYENYYKNAVDALGNNINKFKALALTGYFNCDNAANNHPELPTMTMADIQNLCKKDVPKLEESLHYFSNLSKKHGLQLVMYEGGPGLVQRRGGTDNTAITNKAIAFNKDSHMEKPIVDIMDTWYRLVTQDPANKPPGGLFNYFSYTSTPSKYGSWGMLEYTGQDPTTVAKFRGVQSFINKHFKTNPLGPKCSFLKSGALAYGCFQHSSNHFQCGQSDNNGRSWSFYPSLHQSQGEYLVLDGYNPRTFKLYVRLTDNMGANKYYTYSTHSKRWNTLLNFQYYEEESSPDVLPRFPNGVYHNLDAHALCK